MGKNFFVVIILCLFGSLSFAENINISLVGDICFDGKVEKRISEYGGEYLFEGYREQIENSSLVIGNLETSVSNRGSAIIGKSYRFRSSPEMLQVLKKNKVKIVSIGNNHVMDYGNYAFKDTIKNLRKNGIYFSGGALNKEKSKVIPMARVNGLKIGFIAFSRVIPYTTWHVKENSPGVMGIYPFQEREAFNLIRDAKKRCDILIVSVHFGKERALYPDKDERVLAKKIVDSGADIVMGHHTHTVQDYEYYKGKPIFYSLGNFIFNNSNVKRCNKTVMAVLTINPKGKIENINMVRGEIIRNIPVAYSGAMYKELKKPKIKLSYNKSSKSMKKVD